MDSPLTIREQEILTLMAKGLYYKEIAQILGLSIHTIKTHVRLAIARLGAKNSVHAITIAFRHGYISLNETED